MSGSSIGLPPELHAVKGKVLEDYVRSRILDFAGSHTFAKKLYASPETVKAAAQEALADLLRPGEFEGTRNLKLAFSHTCLSLGCLDQRCGMCKNTAHRRCTSEFSQKYLSGDAIKAKCGAPIIVEVIDRNTGEAASPDALSGLHLEACIVEGKSYGEAEPGDITDAFLDANTLLVDAKGKPVLAPGKGSEQTAEHRIVAKFHRGKAELSVNIIGSSIAMLTGQKPPFRMLVRAIESDTGKRMDSVQWAVSDAFVVATQRVKGAQKAEIPHIEEHVSRIENVGVQTQHKLQDVKASAMAAGIGGFNVVHNCITTVGQFRDLVESSARDVPLQETLRKVLNFTSKGWEAAKAHALKAVETDNRMRVWLSDDTHAQGLLFRCHLGRVHIDAPIGLLSGRGSQPGSRQVEMTATLQQHPAYDRQKAAGLQEAAAEAWWRPGHPGWTIWPADSEQFVRGVVEAGSAASLSPIQVAAPVPATPHSADTVRPAETPGQASSQASGGQRPGSRPLPTSSLQSKERRASSSIDRMPITRDMRSVSLTSHQGGGSGISGIVRPASASQALPGPIQPDPGISGSPASSGAIPADRTASWPWSLPLGSREPSHTHPSLLLSGNQRANHHTLPASPFDLPAPNPSAAPPPPALNLRNPYMGQMPPPATSTSAAGAVGKLDSFSFHPGAMGSARMGMAPNVHSNLQQQPLPTLTTQELEQIMELQRALNMDRAADGSPFPQSLQFLNSLNNEGAGNDGVPQLLSRLSGMLNDPNISGMLVDPAAPAPPEEQSFNQRLASFARLQQEYQDHQDQPGGGLQEGQLNMPPRFSGKVSSIIGDLSDAMSMLKDLLPPTNSELDMAGLSSSDALEHFDSTTFQQSFPMPTLSSYLPKAPPLNMVPSGEGSTGIMPDIAADLRPGGGEWKRRRVDA